MVKRYIWLTSISLCALASSCAGTRTVDKQKSTQEHSESKSSSIEVKSSEESKKGSSDDIEKKDISNVQELKNEASSKNESSSSLSEKKNTETESRKEKYTEYYENGNKKIEREFSEDINKVSIERDSLKKQVVFYKNKLEQTKSESELAYSRITKKLSEVNKNHNEIQKSQDEIKNKISSSSNKTNRDFSSSAWYVVSAIIGFLLCLAVQYLWKYLKGTNWYLKLITYISKK